MVPVTFKYAKCVSIPLTVSCVFKWSYRRKVVCMRIHWCAAEGANRSFRGLTRECLTVNRRVQVVGFRRLSEYLRESRRVAMSSSRAVTLTGHRGPCSQRQCLAWIYLAARYD